MAYIVEYISSGSRPRYAPGGLMASLAWRARPRLREVEDGCAVQKPHPPADYGATPHQQALHCFPLRSTYDARS